MLGETFISNFGNLGVEATRGLIVPGQEDNPILNGISSDPASEDSIFGISAV